MLKRPESTVRSLIRERSVEVEIMFSTQQRFFIVLEYYQLDCTPTATRRSFQKIFNVLKKRHAKVICKIFAKFERNRSVSDNYVGNVGRRQTAVSPRTNTNVSETLQQYERNSV